MKKIGLRGKIIDKGNMYTSYDMFLVENNLQGLTNKYLKTGEVSLKPDEIYKVIFEGKHTRFDRKLLVLESNEDIIIINEEGFEIVADTKSIIRSIKEKRQTCI